MLLIGQLTKPAPTPEEWTARADFNAQPEEILAALTDPELISRWAPVRFDVAGLAGGQLRAGSREQVSGSIAGLGATFEVEVARADRECLELAARGPVSLEVRYRFHEHARGVIVDARIRVRREGGLSGQLVRAAVGGLLNAGALAGALKRLEGSLGGGSLRAGRCPGGTAARRSRGSGRPGRPLRSSPAAPAC